MKKNAQNCSCCTDMRDELMIKDHNGIEWERKKIPVSIEIGEVCLCKHYYDGILHDANAKIFSVDKLMDLAPPSSIMKSERMNIAREYSRPIYEKIKKIRIKNGIACVVESTYRHFYVETKLIFSEYIKGRNKKTISSLNRKSRRIEETNKIEKSFESYSSREEIENFIDLAIEVSEKSFQHRLLEQGIPNTKEFRDDMISKSTNGEIIGYILRVNEIPVAYNLCPIYNGNVALYHYSGYDPEYASYSPGSVLQYKIIEDMFNRKNIDYYDLCTGEGRHKEMFATGFIFCANIYYFSIKNIGIVSIFALKFFILAIFKNIKSILIAMGLKDIIKKKIRRSA